MEEPKFRGYSTDTNTWHEGVGWHKINFEDNCNPALIEKETPQAILLSAKSSQQCELSSIGVFTGLKDQEGKDIYTGDILKTLSAKRRYLVSWNIEEAAFTVKYHYANGEPAEWIISEFLESMKEYKIIGNYFENPELTTHQTTN